VQLTSHVPNVAGAKICTEYVAVAVVGGRVQVGVVVAAVHVGPRDVDVPPVVHQVEAEVYRPVHESILVPDGERHVEDIGDVEVDGCAVQDVALGVVDFYREIPYPSLCRIGKVVEVGEDVVVECQIAMGLVVVEDHGDVICCVRRPMFRVALTAVE